MRRKKEEMDQEIMNTLFRKAFAASNPPGDYDEMLEKAELNQFGQKIIPFMDYECSHEKLQEIFDTTMEEYKVPRNKIRAFSFHFWMGCSPRSSVKPKE